MTGEFAFAKTLNWCVAEGDLPYPNGEALLLSLRSPTTPEAVCLPFAANQNNTQMLVVEPQAAPGDAEKWNQKMLNAADKDAAMKYQASLRNSSTVRRPGDANGHAMVIDGTAEMYNKPLYSDMQTGLVQVNSYGLNPPQTANLSQQRDTSLNNDSNLSDFVAEMSACAASHYRTTIERQSRQLDAIFAMVVNATVDGKFGASTNDDDEEVEDDEEDDDDEENDLDGD